ncbi:hypothetical protein CA13_72220 [Planctomycetes bacterium CA13]|uniref:Uncharacterized protein n=1 Tax=Novipirellula herctigrandis TaxID=2527986 RepID=A0A5C5YP95_9BACT|nr:hypothetical protein CA13_72220 [Planctomycetes bacterium CA13]
MGVKAEYSTSLPADRNGEPADRNLERVELCEQGSHDRPVERSPLGCAQIIPIGQNWVIPRSLN